MYTILHYLDAHGEDHFQDWLDGLRDREAKIAVIRRVARLAFGLAGDRQSVRGGIQELRIDDIASAIDMLRDWKDRNDKNPPSS